MTGAASPEERRAELRIGTTLGGRWTLERLLGVGGMAAVYAVKAPDGSTAALKLLHPEHASRAEIRDRFLREGQAANSVDHPGAVRVLDSATLQDEETAYLVMELLEGESLGERHARARLSADELLDVLDQTLDVLAAAHDRGIVHRDLKPDNLFITRDGSVKVLDFGLARFLDAVPGELKTRTGIAMGTLPYMSPEQALGKRDEIDGRTDLFALGAMSFRLMSGRRVHEADSEAELLLAMATKAAPPLRSAAPNAPDVLAQLVDLALAFSREARYPDARTMQADVRAARAGSPPPYAVRISSAREEATSAERRLPAQAAPVATSPAATADAPAASATAGAAAPGPSPLRGAPRGAPRSAVAVPTRSAPAALVPARSLLARREVVLALALLATLLLVVLLVGVAFTAGRWLGPPSPLAPEASGENAEATLTRDAKKREEELERERKKREAERERKEKKQKKH